MTYYEVFVRQWGRLHNKNVSVKPIERGRDAFEITYGGVTVDVVLDPRATLDEQLTALADELARLTSPPPPEAA